MDKTGGDSKRFEWTAALTLHLLDLWEENIDALRGVRKNTHIYKEMGEKLGVSGVDVKNKVESLTRRYRKEQTVVGPSGGAPSTWEHFDRLKIILSSSKAINYKRVMVDSTDLTPLLNCRSTDEECSEDSYSEPSTSQQGKKRRVCKLDRLVEIEENKLDILQQIAEEIKKKNENTKTFQEKILEVLQNIT